ncbi:MAG: hypothetical protein ACREQL_00485 [Candidatus Binatia bacterium]
MAALAVALAWWSMLATTPVHAQCILDVQGADDQPGQKDLSQFCLVGTCNVSNTSASWSFDDTSWSGNNTGDACALFDSDGDGNANRALCVTLQGAAQMQAGNPKCYTCGDTRPDRCTSAAPTTCISTCQVTLNADPFQNDPNHVGNACKETTGCPSSSTCCRTLDAATTCCLTANDAGTGGVLIDVCSYPSQEPNSDPSDCIVNRQCSKNDPNDPACDDHNPCTVDSCDTTFGVCRHVAGNQGAECRAAAGPCDVAEVCSGTSINCPTDQFAQSGVCRNASDLCDVAESCDGSGAACPPDGVKQQGIVCRSASGNVCDVAEVCDGVSKACPPDGSQPGTTPCDDGNACTTGDHCDGAGGCTGGPAPNCTDNNGCTTDGCNPASGCTHVNNNDPCNDNNACTTNDGCQGGSCAGGPPPNCNDSDVCTDDDCDPATGCTHTNNTVPCSDNNECTTNDRCQGGACAGGPPPVCSDNNVCTDEDCDPATPGGCTHVDNTAPCQDGNPCTENDACSGGLCQPGPQKDCNDLNGCTDDTCNPVSGLCEYVDNGDPCDDGNVCTLDDICFQGSCQSGQLNPCNDGNFCTDDSCTPTTDCQHTSRPDCCTEDSQCVDTDACTTNEHCVNNACESDPVDCADNNECTIDTCNNQGGGFICEHTSCADVQGQPCPDPSCLPDLCGDGTTDTQSGETCDPPGSTTQFPGVFCRTDCTYCGDGVTQSVDGETCDDGNKIQGCIKNDSFPIDPCQNNCTPHVCRDPTKAMLKPFIDKFTFHGRLALGATVDFSSENFAVELTTPSGRVLYRNSVPAGGIISLSGTSAGPFKYTSRTAKLAGGIQKIKIRKQGTDFYRATVTAYGNLLTSQADMLTHVHAGDAEWTVLGAWQERGTVWRFSPATAN